MTFPVNEVEDEYSTNLAKESNKNHKPSPKRRWLKFWLGMGSLAVVSGTVGTILAIYLDSTPLMQANLSSKEAAVFDNERISKGGLQFSQLTRPVDILVMGMSVLPPDIENPPSEAKKLRYLPQVNSFDGLSDVMLLIRFNPQNQKIVMLSIPRDTRVKIEGHGIRKINAANREGGPALSAKTVSELLGRVAIDRYLRINVLGVGKLVDALGGVTVDVPKDMKYQDDSQHLYVNLKAGKQHLNGDKALQLLRYRSDGLGDIGRVQRQQMVIRALMEQTLNVGTVTRLPQILDVVQSHIDTNLTVEELAALLGFGTQINRSDIQMLMVPGRFSSPREFDASYWVPNYDRIPGMMAQYLGLKSANQPQTVELSSLKVAIQDNSGSGANLQPLIQNLKKAGYSNIYVISSKGKYEATTKIIAQQGDENSAAAIRATLGLGEVRVESTGSLNSDITIVLGDGWANKQSMPEKSEDR